MFGLRCTIIEPAKHVTAHSSALSNIQDRGLVNNDITRCYAERFKLVQGERNTPSVELALKKCKVIRNISLCPEFIVAERPFDF